MRSMLLSTVAGLAVGLCSASAADLVGKPAEKKEAEPAPGCGRHGTAIEFVETPSAAAKKAKKEQKLVFVLHVSGLFEDPTLT